MNIPQLIFGLTGLVMPRTVSDSADMAESFAAAGIDEGVAKGLELYLQLAMDVQAQSKDWRRDAQQQPFPFMDKYFEPEESSEPDDEDDVEELKAKLKQLKDANADFREALYHAQREIEAVKEDATKVEAQGSIGAHRACGAARVSIYAGQCRATGRAGNRTSSRRSVPLQHKEADRRLRWP